MENLRKDKITQVMGNWEKLLQYRQQFGVAVVASLVFSLLLYAAPRTLNIVAYFWPLFALTGVFLVLIIAFGGGVSLFATDQVHGDKAGEWLLDSVSGSPEHFQEPREYDS